MIMRPGQPLLLPASPVFIWFSLIVAMMLNMLPVGRIAWMPDFLALTLVFWSVHQPLRIGVVAAFMLSSTLLPAAISLLGIRVPTQHSDVELRLERFADWVLARRRALLAAWTVAGLALVAAIPLNHLNDDFVAYFDESIQFRRDTDFVIDNLDFASRREQCQNRPWKMLPWSSVEPGSSCHGKMTVGTQNRCFSRELRCTICGDR